MDQSLLSVPSQSARCTITLSDRDSLSSRSSTLYTKSSMPIDNPTSHWWESQAGAILRGFDLQAIQLVCRYRTYKDSSTLTSILETRSNPFIKSFLLKLSAGTFSQKYMDDLNKNQIVEELLKWLGPSPPDGLWWHSTLPAALLHLDASKVASELYEESWSLFERITFQDYLRKALYPDEDVETLEAFKNWHYDLVNNVRDRLANFRGETEKFMQVMDVSAAVPIHTLVYLFPWQRLPEGSPVYWAVSQSVLSAPYGSDEESTPHFSLDMIYEPLRDLFSHPDANLERILKGLRVLEERFQQRYRQPVEVDWIHRFDTDTQIFDDITTMSPQELAESLTQSDSHAFSLLEPRSFLHEDKNFQSLNREWDTRWRAVQECIIVDSRLSDLLADLAQELRKKQNFYSLFAVLLALRGSGFDECKLPDLFALINAEGNYASYQKAYRGVEGLPFPPPHIRQLNTAHMQALMAFLPSRRDEHSISSMRPQSLEQPEVSLDEKQLPRSTWAWVDSIYLALAPIMNRIPCLVYKDNEDV